jgi:DNA-binding transcriptional LysR family regulator
VLRRRIEGAFVADCVAHPRLESMAAYREELAVIASESHPEIRRAEDVRTDTVISFPLGCAYRRRIQAWLAAGSITQEKVLELSSYHAIVACVASGTGIAVVPRAVLHTVRGGANVCVYPLPAKSGRTITSLVWRKGEPSSALRALQAEIPALTKA